jgi:hypothetical protein
VPQYISPVRNITDDSSVKRPYILKNSPAISQLEQELKTRKDKLAGYVKNNSHPNRQESHKKRIAELEKALKRVSR